LMLLASAQFCLGSATVPVAPVGVPPAGFQHTDLAKGVRRNAAPSARDARAPLLLFAAETRATSTDRGQVGDTAHSRPTLPPKDSHGESLGTAHPIRADQ